MNNYWCYSEKGKIKLISKNSNAYFYLEASNYGDNLIFIFENYSELFNYVDNDKIAFLDLKLEDNLWQISSSDTNTTTTKDDFVLNSNKIDVVRIDVEYGSETEVSYGFILNKETN